MEKETLSALCLKMEALLEKGGRKKSTIATYKKTWELLSAYMERYGHVYYTAEIGQAFLEGIYGKTMYKSLTREQKDITRHVSVLSDYYLYGTVNLGEIHRKYGKFEGELGSVFLSFMEQEKTRVSKSSARAYGIKVFELYDFLREEKKAIRDIAPPLMMKFVRMQESARGITHLNTILVAVRIFFRYLCSNSLLQDNRAEMWMALFKLKTIDRAHVPSAYTAEEIEKAINAVNFLSSTGKRDYAIMLLAYRTGLRSSDICGLRFCNLIWDQNKIVLVQQKTGRTVSIPLSEDVGCAIIEYLKYERPKTDLPFVFVQNNGAAMNTSSLYRIVSNLLDVAGVNKKGRRSGPHSLRHSLAVNLLEQDIPAPVISDILGHSSPESTTAYLRVSLNLLRKCALDVPPVPSIFYENLYE